MITMRQTMHTDYNNHKKQRFSDDCRTCVCNNCEKCIKEFEVDGCTIPCNGNFIVFETKTFHSIEEAKIYDDKIAENYCSSI